MSSARYAVKMSAFTFSSRSENENKFLQDRFGDLKLLLGKFPEAVDEKTRHQESHCNGKVN